MLPLLCLPTGGLPREVAQEIAKHVSVPIKFTLQFIAVQHKLHATWRDVRITVYVDPGEVAAQFKEVPEERRTDIAAELQRLFGLMPGKVASEWQKFYDEHHKTDAFPEEAGINETKDIVYITLPRPFLPNPTAVAEWVTNSLTSNEPNRKIALSGTVGLPEVTHSWRHEYEFEGTVSTIAPETAERLLLAVPMRERAWRE